MGDGRRSKKKGGVAGWGDGESQSVTMAMGKTGEDVGKRERVCFQTH